MSRGVPCRTRRTTEREVSVTRNGARPSAGGRSLLRAPLLAAALLSSACAGGGLRPLKALEGEFATKITEEDLAERLDRFSELYAQTIIEGVRGVVQGETDTARIRAALVWQMQSIRTCRNAVLASDPQVAFTDVWVLCVQQRAFLETSPFVAESGDHGKALLEGAKRLEAEIQTIGSGFLTQEQLGRARKEVESFAAAFPIRDGFARAAPLPSTAGAGAEARFGWVTSIPMAPFRFVTGIDEGAAAIRHFSSVADRFARRIDNLPQETMWEAQLLLFDVEQRPAVQRTVASLESASEAGTSLAASADRFARTVETLPADLRRELDAALATIDSRQQELRTTIDEVRAALSDARDVAEKSGAVVRDAKSAGEGFDKTAASVGEAAKSLESAVKAYQAMMLSVHPPDAPEKPKEPGGRPFDVLEWKATADSIAAAAAELRGALTEFRTTATDEAVAARAVAAGKAARAEAEAAIDHAFVRALELLAAVALVVVGLRFVRPRPGAGAAKS
jgi:hypothetical protein